MGKNKGFNIKLIFPCKIEYYEPYWVFPDYVTPYGMGILTSFLRQHNYYVEQEDLSIKHNRYAHIFPIIPLVRNKNLDMVSNRNEIESFLKDGEINGRLGQFVDEILDSIRIEEFDLIGFSTFSFYYFLFALMLSKRIKQRFNIPIVFGGSFINLYGPSYPNVFNYVDYMIRGDGCIPLLRLIHYLEGRINIHEVPNITYKDNGRTVTNDYVAYPLEDMPIPDLNDLPLKLYIDPYDLSLSKYNILLPYQITSGCTSKCNFCTFRHVNNKLGFKSYGKIVDELSQMQERYHSNKFHFTDDNINNSYEYLDGLCDFFVKKRLSIGWRVFAKVGNLDRPLLKKMKEAGCEWLFFGIESGSDRILKMMNKGFTSEQASETLRWAFEAGIKNATCFIAGYPFETHKDINQTKEFIKRNKKYFYLTNTLNFILNYGSDVYFNLEQHGIINLSATRFHYFFAFDESCGLKWEQKQKQQAHSKKEILKTIFVSKFFLHLRLFLRLFLKSIGTIVTNKEYKGTVR